MSDTAGPGMELSPATLYSRNTVESVTGGEAVQAVGPGQLESYLRLPDFDGVCDSALAAAVLSALDDFGLASTLLAAVAAFAPVCRLFSVMFHHLRRS